MWEELKINIFCLVFLWLVENENHCDFVKLREMLICTNMEDLREQTHARHYELYRRCKLEEMGFADVGPENKPLRWGNFGREAGQRQWERAALSRVPKVMGVEFWKSNYETDSFDFSNQLIILASEDNVWLKEQRKNSSFIQWLGKLCHEAYKFKVCLNCRTSSGSTWAI